MSEDGRRITTSFANEVYGRLKTFIDQQGAAMQMFGITPNPQQYPWLGPIRATVWRSMRMIKNNGYYGDILNRQQFADDIRATGSFYQKHRELIVDHGILVTDGDSYTKSDLYVYPAFGGTHQLGYTQLQIKAIDRLVDLIPPQVANSVFSITEAVGLGNICRQEANVTDVCEILVGEEWETPEQNLLSGLPPGVCTTSGAACSSNDDCSLGVRHRWGPSGGSGSRCPILQQQCPYFPYPDNQSAVMSQSQGGRCVKFGVNTFDFLIADPVNQRFFKSGADFVFPSDTPLPTGDRPRRFPVFGQVIQHEINHAVTYWLIRRNPVLLARRDELIDRACDDLMQYLHPRKTFCGLRNDSKGINRSTCSENPDPSCNDDPWEFFAGMMNLYLADTQATLNLARVRWDSGKMEPINQFLFIASIYSPYSGSPDMIPFFYQDRFTDSGYYYPTSSASAGLCQYQAATAYAFRDSLGRITFLQTPDLAVHQFQYSGTASNVTNWDVQ